MEPSPATRWEVRDSIALLTLNNPPQNRLAEPAFINPEKLRRCAGDDGIKGIIVTGMGRHFSAGADMDILRSMASDENLLASKLSEGKDLLQLIGTMPVPVIAAIEGACFGGGLEIALACHIRVCAKNALLAFPEADHGLMPGLGGTVRLPALTGFGTAISMILSGDILGADRAREIGLADHVTPPRGALDFSLGLMKKMVADRPVEVIRSIVRSLMNSRSMSMEEAMREETKMFCRLAVKGNG